jgi:hypothetical protein
MESFQAGEPMERMASDIAGQLHKSSAGNEFILVAIDYFN